MAKPEDHPVAAAELKAVYRRRLDMIDAGVISPPDDLVAATRAMVPKLEALDDRDELVVDTQSDASVFRLVRDGAEIGRLPRDADLAEVQDWFLHQGFGLNVERDGSHFWANLSRVVSAEIVAPHYGHGSTPLEAATRARTRFEQEQLGEAGI
jgi:hypothetical protein